MAAMNKCLAQSNKSPTGDKATKKYEFGVEGIICPIRRDPRKGTHPKGRLSIRERPSTASTEHKEPSTMKFVSPDTHCHDYKKRRSAFLKELISSTPNVSLRAQEFRRWIDKNSLYSGNDKA